jgi:hypothetical protein
MAKPKTNKPRRLLRKVGAALLALVVFLLLFVAAFVFNPFEGSLPSLRDAVPRGVNFFVRKERLADDFDPFPQPRFWDALSDARGFRELANGGLGRSFRSSGLDRLLQEAAAALAQVRRDTHGFLDPLRDVLGRELIVAGYELDYSASPPRPLAEPHWCLYARINWRARFVHGLLGFGLVQNQLRAHGVDVSGVDGDLLVRLPGAAQPLRVRRHLDLLMVSNHPGLLEQSQRLIDGSRDEEPIGQMPAYTDGAGKRIERWAQKNAEEPVNVLEFVVEPNAYDGFRRFAASWPDPQHKTSMNQRVLASFLNLRGWQQITGGLMFAPGVLAATGQIGLNSRQHTPFQSSFYRAEQEPREKWLDPFLRMVPESACAAAALRMPAAEFLREMFGALESAEKDLLNDMLRRTTFQGTAVTDLPDLIERLRPAFLPRTGFVFRQNDPVTERDENGELKIPVAARSPIPQVAWVFWLRPGGQQLVEEFVRMLTTYYGTFGFKKQWHLPVQFAGGRLPEPVTEFTNPQIPGTGEIATIVFREFFVLSNSGPLIQDILRTRHSALTGVRSMIDMREWPAIEAELPHELNALVWLHGENLIPMFDDYLAFAESNSEQPDPEWLASNRPHAEEQVRRGQFSRYPSKASMPPAMTEPGGEFDVAVVAWLRELWRKERTNFTAEDRESIQQLRAMAQLVRVAAVQLELENNYIRYQARVVASQR